MCHLMDYLISFPINISFFSIRHLHSHKKGQSHSEIIFEIKINNKIEIEINNDELLKTI
jgi:hypothetical protein